MIDHRRREPAPDVFRLVLPLPFPGLDRVNAYLLAGDEPTLVDCGIFDPAPDDGHGFDDLLAALAACDVAVEDVTRLVVTHPHIDHYGLAGRVMEASGCELWMHAAARDELNMYRAPERSIESLRHLLADHGVSESEIDELVGFEDWRSYVSSVVDADKWLHGGETFSTGGRLWQVVHTPGHSPSHVCVWSPEDRVLISGDHLLGTITPHIDFKRGEDEDPLGEFLTSLEKVAALSPELVLPGHGHPFPEGAERARVIIRHHDRRLGSILQVIRRQAGSASEITDEIFGTTLLNFQRRLALGEALAHLAYLRLRGEIERIQRQDGSYVYKKVSRAHSAGTAE